jgi:hypothetical protein
MKMSLLLMAVVIVLLPVAGYLLACRRAAQNPGGGPAAEPIDPAALFPVRVKGKWGYMNGRLEIVIPCRYEAAEDFSEGLAAVARDTLFGFIDREGTVVADFAYEKTYPFAGGMAMVVRAGKYGFIDRSGKEIIPAQFEEAASFSEGLAAVEVDGKNGFINAKGEMVIAPAFAGACYKSQFSGGLAPVYTTTGEGQGGYIDPKGNFVIPPRFGYADPFSEGLALVRPLGSDRFGFINPKGEWVIEPKYDLSLGFHEGVATVKVLHPDGSATFAIIDPTGKERAKDLKYLFVGIFREGVAAFEDESFRWGFVDRSGREVIPARFASPKFFVNGLARMETGSLFTRLKITYINKNGQVVWQED